MLHSLARSLLTNVKTHFVFQLCHFYVTCSDVCCCIYRLPHTSQVAGFLAFIFAPIYVRVSLYSLPRTGLVVTFIGSPVADECAVVSTFFLSVVSFLRNLYVTVSLFSAPRTGLLLHSLARPLLTNVQS